MTARILAAVLLVIALVTGGYRWGAKATANAWQAKEAKRLQVEAEAREAELRRSEKASGALQAELQQQAITNDALTKAFNDYKRRHPILVRVTAQPSAPALADQAAPTPYEPLPVNGLALTLGAVWMWNSALYNRDAPAGACGLADRSKGACAADSGLTLEDAWDNQALNAKLCAQDRLRHQRLIDFLKRGTN